MSPSAGTSDLDSTSEEPSESTSDLTTEDPPEGASEGTSGEDPLACNPVDEDEPNDIEDEAIVLASITDDDASGDIVESILGGAQDVDWFAYMGQDVAFAYVDPTAELDAELRLCIFVECETGTTPVPTCTGSIYDESPLGFRGCCNTGPDAFVAIDLACPSAGGDDSAFVFMRVDHGIEGECVPYAVEYHY